MAPENKFALTLMSVTLVVGLATALPNIRIQVNNENLKNAPYLLEASRRQEFMSPSSQPSPVSEREPGPAAGPPADSDDSGPFSVIKEETIEEILDLEPESVMKLAPQNLISSSRLAFSDQPQLVAPAPENSPANLAQSEAGNSELPLVLLAPHDNNNSHNNPSNGRKPAGQQLPVANSHLKKPASIVSGDSTTDEITGSGAKSLVSPTILLDSASPSDDKLLNNKKANGQQPPDVWEPNQVMSGVSNVSLVPAIVNRDYGSQTRTRVTLGGGYQRDRQPAADEQTNKQTGTSSASSKLDSGSGSFSHLVEAPERIVLPVGVLSSQQPPKQAKPAIVVASSVSSDSPLVTPPPGRKQTLDSRCPKQGVITFEHPTACDKYFFCEDGYVSEQTCPNGLLYGTRDTVRDYCVHRWKATCEEKSIPNPISSPGCRWQYGIFSVQGSPKCTPDFYECIDGRFDVRKCSIDGQVYDDRTKSCQFSEAVGCAQEALGDFQCPPDDQGNTYWPFPRYFLNDRALIHCVNDKPDIIRCVSGERVDPEHLHCVPVGKLQAKSQSGGPLDVPLERRARERKKDKASS